MQVIPAVDVLDGKVVRLLKGDYDAVTTYGDDVTRAVERWRDEGAGMVHVVDLDGARSGVPDIGLARLLGSSSVRVQLGGGIRTATAADDAVSAGVERVVVGSAVVAGEEALTSLVARVGADSVVAAIDVAAGRARGSGWLDDGTDLAAAVSTVAASGVRRVLVTGIESDGTMDGPNLPLLSRVARLAPQVSIVASGGVGTLDDLRRIADLGAEAVVVGRALYENRFSFTEAVAAAG